MNNYQNQANAPIGYTIIRDAYQRSLQQANSFPDFFNNAAGQSRVSQAQDQPAPVAQPAPQQQQQQVPNPTPVPPGSVPQAALLAQQIILQKLNGSQQYGPSNRPTNMAGSMFWQQQPGYNQQFDPIAGLSMRNKAGGAAPIAQSDPSNFSTAAAYLISLLSGRT